MLSIRARAGFLALCLSSVPVSALAAGWNAYNSPATMFPLCRAGELELPSGADRRCYTLQWEGLLSELPASLRLRSQEAWSDTYWPDNKGGIAYRWQTRQKPWGLRRPTTVAQVRALSSSALREFSPAEKFDLYLSLKRGGAISYALTQRVMAEVDRRGPSWEGICHGWSIAALRHPEPRPVTVSAGGIALEFAASDVKALLDYYYANYPFPPSNVHLLEESCEAWRQSHGREPRPGDCTFKLNPGSFHVVLLNQLGRFDEGFVLDVDNGIQIWNQPVVGVDFDYASAAMGPGATPGTATRLHVVAHTHYVKETDPFWDPVLGTPAQKEKTIDYAYTVDLGSGGEILGGEWDARSAVPDFLWRKPRAPFGAARGLPVDFSALQDLMP